MIYNRELDTLLLNKQNDFFDTARITALAVSNGKIKSFVLAGPAGVGKSFGIEKALKDRQNIVFVGGHVSNGGLYTILFNNRFNDKTIVFDDSDSILQSEISLGLLKHALESKPIRHIAWVSQARLKNYDGSELPPDFDFEASIIFLSNLNLSQIAEKNTKLSPHIEAIISRSVYLDAYKIFDSPRAFLVRINELKGYIFKAEKINPTGASIISEFINTHYLELRELSLRLIVKLSQIYKIVGPAKFMKIAKLLTGK